MTNSESGSLCLFRLFLFLLLINAYPGTYAQKQNVSLAQCIDSVQTNSYLLRAEEFNTKATARNINIRHAAGLPSISGDIGAEGRFLGSEQYSFAQQWTMIHGDWSPGNLISKTENLARQQLVTARLKQEKVRIDGICRVTSLYMSVLQKQKQIELFEKRLAFLEKHKTVAQSLWKAGVKTRLDVLQTETEISVTLEDKVRGEMEIRNLLQELAVLTGFKPDGILIGNVDAASLVDGVDEKQLDMSLIIENPMYKMLQSQVQTQQLQLSDIEAKQWPHVFVGGGYFVDGDPSADGNFWSLQTGIKIPVYQWKEIKNRKSQVMLRSEAKSLELHNLERELSIHVTNILTRLEELKKMLGVSQKRMKTLDESLELALLNYKAGWITNLELLAVQQQVTKNMIRIEAVRLEYILNLTEFYLTTNQVGKIKDMAASYAIPGEGF
ncbi:MAG: TolC family protein [Chlorobi bacterium]|nr:TolC family protein [Chlorobiota bacterium]